MLLSLNVYSQSYILIGNDNNITGSPTPYEGYWHDARMQIIYSVSELTDAGLSSGSVITGLGFDIAAVASTQAYTGFTVKMAHTSTTSFGSTAWLTPSFTQVYSASYTVTATGWTMHGFSTNFTWNGTSNIVVEVCFDNTTYTGDDDVYYSTTTDPMVCYAYSDNDSGCSMAAEYTSTSRPNIIFRTAGSSTITTCSAVFFDSGGPSGTYANNENYTVTYTSSSGGCIRAIVENYDVEYDYDYLYIYDGTSTAGTLLDVLNGPSVVANLDDEGTSYYGLSGSLTFHFTSDVSNTYSGWEFTIDCPQNCYPPSCSNTVPANDNCTSSTMICDFNGYCGSTSGTVDHSEIDAANSAIFCGIIDNNTWLSFVASETEATLDVWVTDCPTAGSDGIGAVQLQVYETDCSTGNFTPVSNCWSPAKLVDGQIRATGLTPGNEYMIMVDGWNGAECNYSFAASSGVAAASAGLDQTLCEGQVVTFTASGGTVYSWASDPVDPSLSGQESSGTINVSPSSTTTYSVTVTGLNPECPGTAEAAAIVNAASATFTGLDASYCSDDASVSLLPDPTGGTITGSGI
ncbi:MAG: hypothetical protein C0594_09095 [Marinilabiliales bacterium]|nr:MAG: hypothetical protein C0594_09095 [Marinilabiliales bacterium]